MPASTREPWILFSTAACCCCCCRASAGCSWTSSRGTRWSSTTAVGQAGRGGWWLCTRQGTAVREACMGARACRQSGAWPWTWPPTHHPRALGSMHAAQRRPWQPAARLQRRRNRRHERNAVPHGLQACEGMPALPRIVCLPASLPSTAPFCQLARPGSWKAGSAARSDVRQGGPSLPALSRRFPLAMFARPVGHVCSAGAELVLIAQAVTHPGCALPCRPARLWMTSSTGC